MHDRYHYYGTGNDGNPAIYGDPYLYIQPCDDDNCGREHFYIVPERDYAVFLPAATDDHDLDWGDDNKRSANYASCPVHGPFCSGSIDGHHH